MKFNLQSLLAAFIFLSVVMVSCQKEGSVQSPEVTDAEAQTIAEEQAAADAEYDDVTEIGLEAGADLEAAVESNNGEFPERAGTVNGRIRVNVDFFINLRHRLGPCTEITVDPNDSTFPKTITIDYGDGCLCRDGKFRKGAIILHFTAPIRRPGAVLTITFRDFYVNRAHIEGVKTISNLSANGALKYSVQVENGKVTWPNGRGFAYAGLKVVTQVRGMDTRECSDDVFSIEGRSKIEYASGLTVTKNTESPLIKPVACRWITQGVLKIKINSRIIYIDYGNGECDNKAILKWANGEIEITLP